MEKHYAIISFGRDKPGIVADLSALILKTDGNIKDSTMSTLHDRFAMIVVVSFPKAVTMESISSSLQVLEKAYDIHIHIEELRDSEMKPPRIGNTKSYLISILGKDRPGIFNKLANKLNSFKANIVSVKTQILEVEQREVYAMVVEIELPLYTQDEEFIFDLKSFGTQIGADLTIKAIG
jgi:predicted amino acid-binding ACT domain protein